MGENVEKVLSCFVIGMLLMSVFPVSVFASKPIPTRIHLQDATFEWHTNQSLIAKLVDENGQPLSGKKIIFYVNTSVGWRELGYSTTNESGIAKYDIFVTMPDGNYTFKAVFKGDMRYFSSSDTAVIRVKGDVLPVVAIYLGTGITLAAASYFLAPYIASYFGSAFSSEIVQSIASNLVAIPSYVEKAKKVLEEMMEFYQQYYYYMTQKRIQDSKDLADLADKLTRELIDELNVSEDIYNEIFPIAEKTYKTYAQKIYLNLEDYVKSGVVDNIVGYTHAVYVPQKIAKMTIVISWNESVCPPTLYFYELRDPNGDSIRVVPTFHEINTQDYLGHNITVAKIEVYNPLSGEWILYLNGSVMPNWEVVTSFLFDRYVEIVPKHQAVNPGGTVTYKVLINNFKNSNITVNLSLRDVPANWNVELSKAQITLAPNTSDIICLNITPPETVRYGVNKTITVVAVFEDDNLYFDNCTIWISPETEIEEGLAYLHERHLDDGSWCHNVGITALSTLAFLNHGCDEGDKDVREGIDYILSHVHSDGSIYGDYNHRTYFISYISFSCDI